MSREQFEQLLKSHDFDYEMSESMKEYNKENGTWSYCAGQSYPDEIRTLRECILNG